MQPPGNARQASVGESSLLLPDHQDSGREQRPSVGRKNRPTLDSFLQDPSFRSRGGYSRISTMDASDMLSVGSGLGVTGAIRSAAAARHWVNQTRRNKVKDSMRGHSLRADPGRNSGTISELTALHSDARASIPEVPDDASSPPCDTVEALKSIIPYRPS